MREEKPLTQEYEVDEPDRLRQALFKEVQDLRKRGYTPKEIAPRLRNLADSLERHFGDTDSWDAAPVDRDPVFPGDPDE